MLLDGLFPDDKLVVGLDTERNVDLNVHCAGLPDRCQTALLQLAHN